MHRKGRYTLILENRSSLQGIFSWSFTRWRLALVIVASFLVSLLIAWTLIVLTPLKRLTPGYTDSDMRRELVEAVIRIDSLQARADLQTEYIDNMRSVLVPQAKPEASDSAGVVLGDFNPDDLLDPSEREQVFISRMNDRERSRGRTPAYASPEGIYFISPAEGALPVKDKERVNALLFRVPQGEFVNAIADGKVVDKYRMQDGYVLLLQHSGGYLTKYSMVASPLVDQGERVDGGEPLASAVIGAGRNLDKVRIEMWHNGNKLNPADYIRVPDIAL